MFFFTQAQYDQLIRNGSTESEDRDFLPVAKLHIPGASCAWLLTELNPQDPMIAFGLCDLGMQCPELGYVDLAELAAVRLPVNICVQTDSQFTGDYPISVYASAAREQGAITDDDTILQRHQRQRKPPRLSPV